MSVSDNAQDKMSESAENRSAPVSLPDDGLSSDEARRHLESFEKNSIAGESERPVRPALAKLWAPVPWMLEAAIVLQVAFGEYAEAAVVAVLLLFNAGLGYVQESRTQATLTALNARLAFTASVKRDGRWVTMPAAELVPGDRCR
jgi:H+-transporting ATPase